MRKMNLVIIVLIILALFITGYIFIKKSLPESIPAESVKYSFPISGDVPKPKAPPMPTYDLPSATLPEPEPASPEESGEPNQPSAEAQ